MGEKRFLELIHKLRLSPYSGISSIFRPRAIWEWAVILTHSSCRLLQTATLKKKNLYFSRAFYTPSWWLHDGNHFYVSFFIFFTPRYQVGYLWRVQQIDSDCWHHFTAWSGLVLVTCAFFCSLCISTLIREPSELCKYQWLIANLQERAFTKQQTSTGYKCLQLESWHL